MDTHIAFSRSCKEDGTSMYAVHLLYNGEDNIDRLYNVPCGHTPQNEAHVTHSITLGCKLVKCSGVQFLIDEILIWDRALDKYSLKQIYRMYIYRERKRDSSRV